MPDLTAAVIEDPQLRAKFAEAVALLDQVAELRHEIHRLAPDNGHTPNLAELRSILETARHLVDFPMVDRCGCGWTDDTARVQYHRRGSNGCRAGR